MLLKTCPICNRTYADQTFSFCLDDGALLSAPMGPLSAANSFDDEVETIVRPNTADEVETVLRRPTSPGYTGAPIADIKEPVILITVNKLYKPDISPELLYEITRGVWRIGERRSRAKYAFAVYKGIIREVYEIHNWHPAPEGDSDTRKKWIAEKNIEIDEIKSLRWQFDGSVSEELRHYVGCSTARYQVRGAQNPIKYVNC